MNSAFSMQRKRCDQTPAWQQLQQYFEATGQQLDVREAFVQDSSRYASFSQQAPHVFADLSKNRVDATSQQLLLQLARECELERYRDAMFAGDAINQSEDRAVMHWLLRQPEEGLTGWLPGSNAAVRGALQEVHASLNRMLALAEQVRANPQITDIVNIGIGGSDLGPAMVVNALEDWRIEGKRFHFVSNVDGHELGHVLAQIRPESTLFLVASKSFTTLETMVNAHSAREWFVAQGGSDDRAAALSISKHFWALTTNTEAAARFGIDTTLGFWDWVGGRYSLWSVIGLPIAIAVGAAHFRALLGGAHDMDVHFKTAPLESNLPVRMGLLDIWYRNFFGFGSRCVAPYSHGLRRLSAYLQQLEMESNGKGMDVHNQVLPYSTSPVVWGEPGTNGQHAFFQMIHQGRDVIPVEFIAARDGGKTLASHQNNLVINAIAQAQALLVGRTEETGPRYCPGNRPSTFLLVDKLSPTTLGALIALYEHRVFVSGALWGINSFDQWGVELGKQLAKDLFARRDRDDWQGVDPSTQALVGKLAP
ncbi:glucose-6-phosphate isomerase [Comamonas odontotermitis]|uniref:Glucose-6-phosphate isomerase n=1 Tax=Comamonas odontotermitis TaxID=379895 RepID=A0ABR6RE45_9BURK|nr:glucose-6-phosphate isomerase [Comamonas odontotermitis]MBB6577429.1 glucose-6-phosphate isomerase [Comamonas odontotermitis]